MDLMLSRQLRFNLNGGFMVSTNTLFMFIQILHWLISCSRSEEKLGALFDDAQRLCWSQFPSNHLALYFLSVVIRLSCRWTYLNESIRNCPPCEIQMYKTYLCFTCLSLGPWVYLRAMDGLGLESRMRPGKFRLVSWHPSCDSYYPQNFKCGKSS